MENKKASKRGTKQEQPQPLKVVYISNPMKLKTSASNFRSVVQELTGQHSALPVDPSKYSSQQPTAYADNDAHADVDLSTSSTSQDNNIGTAEPSQPSDQDANYADDRVVLIHHHMLHYMLHDHQDFTPQSDSRNKF